MTVRRIVTLGEPVLRRPAKKIHRFDYSTQQLVDDLFDTLRAAPGSGLAAPQIGVSLRALVTIYEENERVILNPEIVEISEEQEEGEEGCLSVPGWYGPVNRKLSLTIRGRNPKGKPIKIKTDGWEARIFQHEIDHLDGIMYTDRMTDEQRRRVHKVESKDEEEELEDEQVIA